jgi:hypothetical protein
MEPVPVLTGVQTNEKSEWVQVDDLAKRAKWSRALAWWKWKGEVEVEVFSNP